MKVVMKGTILFLAVNITILLVWLFISSIAYFTTDLSFKDALYNETVLPISGLLGVLSAIIVYCDLEEYLK